MNAHFAFTGLMFGLFAVVRDSYGPQGRNWFPFILPILLIATDYAPKALAERAATRLLSMALIAGLVLYCLVSVYYSAPSIVNRYYVDSPVPARLLSTPLIVD